MLSESLISAGYLKRNDMKTKPKKKREQNLNISNTLISTLQSPKCTAALLVWDVQGGKTWVKNRHSVEMMEAGEV